MTTHIDDLPEAPETVTTTAVTVIPPFTGQLVPLNPMIEALENYRAMVSGLDPSKIIATTRKERLEILKKYANPGMRGRNEVIRVAKKTREEATKTRNDVIAAEKKMVAAFEEIEKPWADAADKIENEIAAEAETARAALEEKSNARVALLATYGIVVDFSGMLNGKSILAGVMTDDTFRDMVSEPARKAFEAQQAEQKRKDDELLRLQLDARLVTRQAELRTVECDPDTIEGLRSMEENEYQSAVSIARQAITDRQEEIRRQQQQTARQQQEQADTLARQAREIKDGLRSVRMAALKGVDGVQPTDNVTDMDLDVAEMSASDWDAWLKEQAKANDQRIELARQATKRAAEAQRIAQEWFNKIEALGLNAHEYILTGMNPDVFESQYELAKKDATKRDEGNRRIKILTDLNVEFGPSFTGQNVADMTLSEFEKLVVDVKKDIRISTLRTEREKVFASTPGHDLYGEKPDFGVIEEEAWQSVIITCATLLKGVKDAEAARIEAMKPDQESIARYIAHLRHVSDPTLMTKEGRDAWDLWFPKFDSLLGTLGI